MKARPEAAPGEPGEARPVRVADQDQGVAAAAGLAEPRRAAPDRLLVVRRRGPVWRPVGIPVEQGVR
ncbi:MAG: hypothetical protein ACR2RV_08880, partial [Verrucomicrobiales bacterium]